MLDQNAILDANDVRRNSVHGKAKIREPSVHDHEISFGHDRLWLVLEGWRKAFDEIEQALAAGRDMSAVLDVTWRPELLSRSVVTLVEKDVKRLQNQSLVSFLSRLSHAACFLLSGRDL
jgi:hypothetical protein